MESSADPEFDHFTCLSCGQSWMDPKGGSRRSHAASPATAGDKRPKNG